MLSRLLNNTRMITSTHVRAFRPNFQMGKMNIYKHNPTPLTAVESQRQEDLPVWDRIFDHQKYMQHEGPLKVSIFIFLTIIILFNSYPLVSRCWTLSHSQEWSLWRFTPSLSKNLKAYRMPMDTSPYLRRSPDSEWRWLMTIWALEPSKTRFPVEL